MSPFHVAYYESKHTIYKNAANLLVKFGSNIFQPTTQTNNKAWDNKTIEDRIFKKNSVPHNMLDSMRAKHNKVQTRMIHGDNQSIIQQKKIMMQ